MNPICEKCGLYKQCKKPFSKGRLLWGDKDNIKIICIGECFGAEEELVGIPFVGRSGKLLEDVVKQVVPPHIGVYVTNAVKCAPYKRNKIRTPSDEEIQYCKEILIEELLQFPENVIIVTLGNTPLFSLKRIKQITKYAGKVLNVKLSNGKTSKTFKVVPNFHPAYILRFPHKLGEFASIIANVVSYIENKSDSNIKYKILSPIEGRQLLKEMISDTRYNHFYADIESASIITKRVDGGLVLGIALTHDYTDENYYLPFVPYMWDHEITPVDIAAYKKLLSQLFTSKQVIGHNIKYDIVQLKYEGYINEFDVKDDTYILAHIVYNRKYNSLTLKDLARTLFSVFEDWDLVIKEIIKKKPKDQKSYKYIPTEILGKYACIDIYYTKKLYHKLLEDIRESDYLIRSLYKNIEEEVIHWELAGIPIDFKYLEYANIKITEAIESAYQKINSLPEVSKFLKDRNLPTLNVNSTAQLREVMFKYLNFPILKRTESGNPSLDKAVISEYQNMELSESQRKFIQALIELRDLLKYKGSYLNTFPEHRDEPTNICRFSFHICGTVTGRVSSPIHSLPSRGSKRELKRLVISRNSEDGIIVSLDYSQLEPRIMASISGEEALIEAYKKGIDIYRYIGSKIYNVSPDEIDKSTRQKMKAILLGMIYGKTRHSLANDLGISEDEAKQLINDFFRSFPKVKQWIDRQHAFVRKHKYIVTPLGRIIPIPEIDSPNVSVQEEALRKSQNYPIQSSASELALYNFCLFSRILREKYNSWVICSVHDSLIIDTRREYLLSILDSIKFYLEDLPMKKFDFLRAPLKCDIAIGLSWGGKLDIEERQGNTIVVSGYEEDLNKLNNIVNFSNIKILERWDEPNQSPIYPYNSYSFVKAKLEL